jgi:PAS domain S-box-containing protein
MKDHEKSRDDLLKEVKQLRRKNFQLKKQLKEQDVFCQDCDFTKELLDLIFENSPIGICVVEAQGAILFLNKKFIEITGYNLHDIPTVEDWFQKAYPDPYLRRRIQNIRQSDWQRDNEHILREFPVFCKSGEIKYLQIRALFSYDNLSLITFIDITEQKNTEAALRESEERYRRFFEDAVVGIFQSTPDGKIIDANPALAAMFGFHSPKEISWQVKDIRTDLYADPTKRPDIIKKAAHKQGLYKIETQFRRIDDSLFTGNLNIWAVRDSDSNLLYLEGFIEDISEITQAKHDLKRKLEFEKTLSRIASRFIHISDLDQVINLSLEEVGLLIDSTQVLLFFLEKDGNSVLTSHNWSALEIDGQHDTIQDIDLQKYPWLMSRIKDGQIVQLENTLDLPLEAASEKVFFDARGIQSLIIIPVYLGVELFGFLWFEDDRPLSSLQDDDIDLLCLFSQIIGNAFARKKTEDTLIESERKLATLIGNLPGMAFRSRPDVQRTMEFVSEGCFELTGFNPQDHVHNRISYADLIHKEDRDHVRSKIRQALLARQDYRIIYRIHTFHGQEKWVYERGVGVFSGNQQIEALEGIIIDVSDQKRAEEALIEKDRLLRSVIDNLPIFLFAHDTEGTFTLVEGKGLEDIGVMPVDLLGQNIFKKYAHHPKFIDNAQKAISGKEFFDEIEMAGVILKTFHTFSLNDHGQIDGAIGVAINITEQKEMEEGLRQKEKMEAIGALAGGIAHDFNNVLAAIGNLAYLAKEDLPGDNQAAQDLAQIIDSTEQGKKLVSQILSFSRKSGTNKIPIQLSSIVKETLKLLRASLPKTIEIKSEILNGWGMIEADPTDIQKLLINLCTNASDVMPENGGTITVGLDKITLTAKDQSSDTEYPPGEYMAIYVSDDGPGIDNAIRKRFLNHFSLPSHQAEVPELDCLRFMALSNDTVVEYAL